MTLTTIAREWGRIGCLGFGGPPTHIAMLRKLCVTDRDWLSETDFQDAVAATNLLPGPASTQLAIYCAWRLRGRVGAILGGLCFIIPGLILILALSVLFLGSHTPLWARGAAAGAGSAVPVVALHAAWQLTPPAWKRAGKARAARIRWIAYAVVGAAAAIWLGPFVVLALLSCALVETLARADRSVFSAHRPSERRRHGIALPTMVLTTVVPRAVVPAAMATGGMLAVAWVALKVGALSYGGGFVIIPLMRHDAVDTYHWMTGAQFLDAVALGQITPGPVVQTVAVVGYAASGLAGGLLAAAIAFTPSFCFVLAGAPHFDRLRHDSRVQAFLTGAGPAAIGAIAGSAIPLGLSLSHPWQVGVLAGAVLTLFALRRGVVATLLGAAGIGVLAALAGLVVSAA